MEKDIYHITPVNDLEIHLQESSTNGDCLMVNDEIREVVTCKCKCNPTIKYELNGVLVVHNSFDGREGVELANEILNK